MKTIHKLLIAFAILLTLFVAAASGQTSPGVETKAKTQTQQSLTKEATLTKYLYKGLPVYMSSKGNYFVIRRSKKTGNLYKEYVTIK